MNGSYYTINSLFIGFLIATSCTKYLNFSCYLPLLKSLKYYQWSDFALTIA